MICCFFADDHVHVNVIQASVIKCSKQWPQHTAHQSGIRWGIVYKAKVWGSLTLYQVPVLCS